MAKYQFTSVERVLAKFERDFRGVDIHEGDAIEWIGEALGFMEYPAALEPCVVILPVKNYQASIPENLKYIVQMVKSNRAIHLDDITTLETEVPVEEEGEDCRDCGGFVSNLVPVDSQGYLIGDYEVAYYRPFFDKITPEVKDLKFSPIRPSSNTFFHSVVCSFPGMQDLYKACNYEYALEQGRILFNFKNGYVALSFLRVMTDKRGYPMVPDDTEALTAINYYLGWKTKERECWNHREGACQLAEKAESKWNDYIAMFNNHAFMPTTLDDYQDILEGTKYLIPNDRKYYSNFSTLNHAEVRKYADPDNRNTYFKNPSHS